ncbi:ribonuclease H-like domain-containing protein [Chaetomium fimeti]|uniref:Ribonuclease H-like domain-containing protein n=1 Tax=Chaetomium fimeti TaxID=1854472 RepID=A0AAE0LW59_9PEZI|nr:ribonuclease H-like domain-containing protein [Chaetomium fimeti]
MAETGPLAHVNLPAGGYPSVHRVQPVQPLPPVPPSPEVVTVDDGFARFMAGLELRAQSLGLQTGQSALGPTSHGASTYTLIPAPAEAPALTHTPPATTATQPAPQPAPPTAAAVAAAVAAVAAAAAPPPPPPPLKHRGITYTTLTPTEQTALHPLLLNHTHPPTRLSLEGYALTACPPKTIPTPPRNPLHPRHHAVVLDCEMAGTSPSRADDYPISLSLLDFFTGAVLVDALVRPAGGVVVRDWRSGITGITAGRMAAAGREESGDGEPLVGREGARERVLEFVDAETVVVGQAVQFDLKALGLVHGRVVDSAVVTAEASGKFANRGAGGGKMKISGQAGLEKLCRELLGVRIRRKGQSHDSLEDVLATREVVVWCLRHPEELKAWAEKRWQVGKNNKKAAQGKKGGSGRNKKTTAQPSNARAAPDNAYRGRGWDSDDGLLRWEDVVDYDCWPKSPPDWSD